CDVAGACGQLRTESSASAPAHSFQWLRCRPATAAVPPPGTILFRLPRHPGTAPKRLAGTAPTRPGSGPVPSLSAPPPPTPGGAPVAGTAPNPRLEAGQRTASVPPPPSA